MLSNQQCHLPMTSHKTVKIRCSYDRQRGINLNSSHEDGVPTASCVPVIQGRQTDDTNKHSTNFGNSSCGAATMTTGSGEGQSGGAFAPCCEGGMLDNGSVGQILARSLGNAVVAVRRNRSGEGEGEARETTNKRGGGYGGDSGKGNSQTQARSAMRSRWRSWNEAPPHVLLTPEEIQSELVGQQKDDRQRQRPPPDVVAEVVPPLQNRQSRRRFNNGTGNSTSPDGKNDLSEHSTHGVSRVAAATAAAAAKGTPNSEVHSRGSKKGGPLSTASSASSRRFSAGGVPLVPRVAMLAAASTADENHTEAVRRGKDFDPDQLECVRRHEASVAEKERRVRSLRNQEEKRTFFRARPLPVFLESGGATGSVSRASSSGGGVGQSTRDHGSGLGAAEVTETSPELLAALEQVRRRIIRTTTPDLESLSSCSAEPLDSEKEPHSLSHVSQEAFPPTLPQLRIAMPYSPPFLQTKDEEARALAEKIRKINPRADIASIVLQSTPRRAPLPSQTSWNSDAGSGPARRPSSRGASFSGKTPAAGPFTGGDSSLTPSFASLSGAEGAAVAVRSGGSEATTPVRTHEREAASNPEGKLPLVPGTEKQRMVEIGSGPPDAGPEEASTKEENPRASNSRIFQTAVSLAAEHAGIDEAEGTDGRDPVEGNRCSLMGRMLGSGMLERQREWAKARNRKVRRVAGGGQR